MKIIKNTILILFTIALTGCSTFYIPNKLNTPLFREKNEMKASISMGFSGYNPQLAYPIDNNIGVMLNGSFFSDSSLSYSNNFIELGVGYKYIKFNTQFGISLPLFYKSLEMPYFPFLFSAGLEFNIGNMIKPTSMQEIIQ